MNTIQKLTKDCKGNCSIQGGYGTTTLMGYIPSYDKNGNITSKNPNITEIYYSCTVCKTQWTVRQKEGEEDIIREHSKDPIIVL